MISKDKSAALNNVCKEIKKEDKKIHNISNNNESTKNKMTNKDVNLFSKDELATLNNFCKDAAKEDKKMHNIPNISNNNTSTKKPVGTFYNQVKQKQLQ